MKHRTHTPSVTSLPPSPRDESSRRVRQYAITMGIRTVCFLLMALVQPMGWWTFVFAAGAIFLPYIAVISANAGSDSTASTVESPQVALESAPPEPEKPSTPDVLTIQEIRDEPTATPHQNDRPEDA